MDSSTWPFTLAVYERGPDGKPTKWVLVEHDKSGSKEAAQAFRGWTCARDGGTLTNEHAASVGWPLPHPDTATPLQRRPYDRDRFAAGQVISDPRVAAIFAPGDFPDVDATRDPPEYYQRASAEPPVPTQTHDSPPSEDTPNAPPLVASQRAPQIGDRVVVAATWGGYADGVVSALSQDAAGARTGIVRLEHGDGWHEVVAWVQS